MTVKPIARPREAAHPERIPRPDPAPAPAVISLRGAAVRVGAGSCGPGRSGGRAGAPPRAKPLGRVRRRPRPQRGRQIHPGQGAARRAAARRGRGAGAGAGAGKGRAAGRIPAAAAQLRREPAHARHRCRTPRLGRRPLGHRAAGDPYGKARTAHRRIAEVIDLVGASAYADRPIGQCSGGEQQRLLIAQALVRRPELLLLDEPLDSLDLPNQAAVAALIGRICQEEE